MKIANEKLKKVISELTGTPVQDIQDETEFVKDLHMDSLKLIELLAILSEDFNLNISEDDARQFHTYKNLYDYTQLGA